MASVTSTVALATSHLDSLKQTAHTCTMCQPNKYYHIDVEVRTLDSFGFEDVGFIKIDVEGFEREVLMGGIQTILKSKPILYIEDDRIPLRQALREMIKSLGYTFVPHQPTLYREENFFNLKRNIWNKNYASHNLICTYAHD